MAAESESTRRVRKYLSETVAATISEISSPDGRPSITFRRRYQKASFFINPNTHALEATETTSQITYTWPGKDAYEAWKYTVSMRVLAAIAEAVHSGIVVSKRDIYYSDPACFGTQKVVDAIVDDFAHTIGVDRAVLNVDAAAKGLVAGCYRQMAPLSHETLNEETSLKETLIPRVQDIPKLDVSKAEWILIVEKEAVFRRLAGSNFHIQSATGKGILITGKGYPDLNTRAFVRAMYDSCKESHRPPRIYILVDSDPDGMAIMSTYKYGSMAHANENARLNIPFIRWLGLRTSDVVVDADPLGDDALINLTPRDRKKAISMLSNNPVWSNDCPEPEWRAELQQMLMLNLKAEIETLYNREETKSKDSHHPAIFENASLTPVPAGKPMHIRIHTNLCHTPATKGYED